jgi:four helix bundle protein
VKTNVVKDKTYAFALRIVELTRQLREHKEFELAGQVLRAGTSIGANVEEALAGISRADFIAKMSVASKEARESHYWLRILRDSKTIPIREIDPLIDECEAILRILTAIVKTSQSSHNSKSKIKN